MDRYVLLVSLNPKEHIQIANCFSGLESAKQIYDSVKDIAISNWTTKISPFPPCSLAGTPVSQRWYFAIQASRGSSQFCSMDWEELATGAHKSDSEEIGFSAMEACHSALDGLGEGEDMEEAGSQAELYEEAAEALHQLSDKLPAPGKALLDVIVLAADKEAPKLKEFLPVFGSLKHMQAWHSAKMTIVTENSAGWQKTASYFSAILCGPDRILNCIDDKDIWRGSVLIKEKKLVSELRFGGFCLKHRRGAPRSKGLSLDPSQKHTDHKQLCEVFHYYRPVLDLVQLVRVSDLPIFLLSSTEYTLELSAKSSKSKLLLDQLRSLRGKVGALFSLACTVSSLAAPPTTQLSSQKWREFVAQKPKSWPVPDTDVKGESGHYFLLVQRAETGGCTARLIHSANQLNGAAALATVNGILREKTQSSDTNTADWLRSLPCLHGDRLIQREKKLAKVQMLALKECLRRREQKQKPASVPVNDLKVLLSLARKQYLEMHDSCLPKAALLLKEKENCSGKAPEAEVKFSLSAGWPERSVLQNSENQRKNRLRTRSSLMQAGGSSESLLGPKEGQRAAPALLDARELLKHFTSDGQPSGELQPLQLYKGEHTFQLSPDLTPGKVSQLPFNKASSSHYHGIEFCLDEQKALDRDRGFVKLQSRLIRYETHTTCSKDPCPVPFALSPAPSPAMLSEPGSVPDGEALLAEGRGEPRRLKRQSWDTDSVYPHKRLSKSESSESLASQGSGSSGTHPAVRALRQQRPRSQSNSSSGLRPAPVAPTAPKPPCTQGMPQTQSGDQASKESRSQKHVRMLKEVVAKTLKHHGISDEHRSFNACSQRLFDISKFYLKDLKTSRGLHEEMKKAASSNAKQVIDWVLEKASMK
ncbi:mdm2-binding protein isoform X2 [Conger conger]|uniref:mdm2-binding protein isoform X2 n=1 Tax=Conger conger TaxID=82655 RepID=UPI002A5ADE18|nr:mdm2-binding protein isoform X2 [Conger conger]